MSEQTLFEYIRAHPLSRNISNGLIDAFIDGIDGVCSISLSDAVKWSGLAKSEILNEIDDINEDNNWDEVPELKKPFPLIKKLRPNSKPKMTYMLYPDFLRDICKKHHKDEFVAKYAVLEYIVDEKDHNGQSRDDICEKHSDEVAKLKANITQLKKQNSTIMTDYRKVVGQYKELKYSVDGLPQNAICIVSCKMYIEGDKYRVCVSSELERGIRTTPPMPINQLYVIKMYELEAGDANFLKETIHKMLGKLSLGKDYFKCDVSVLDKMIMNAKDFYVETCKLVNLCRAPAKDSSYQERTDNETEEDSADGEE